MEKSTIELLTEYNIDPQNTAIKQYYDADNLWKTLHIERDENKHSAFLAWLFEHDVNSENSPLIKLLNLLVLRSTEEQDRNKDLFMRAIDVMIATTTDEDEKADLEDLQRTIKKTSRRHYTINGQGDYSMYQVIEEFAIYMMKTNKTIDDVDKLVKSYIRSRKEFLSKDKDKVKRIKNGKEEYYTFSYDGVDYFGTKEWSGDNDGNFQKLTKGINKNYPDFQIVEI